MTVPFGPQLIGETEKSLGALLRRHLARVDLTEPQWVTLRLADLLADQPLVAGLAGAVADRAHVADAPALVAGLEGRGLLAADRLTEEGTRLLQTTQAEIAADTRDIWEGLDEHDAATAGRVLNEVVARARRVLASA